MELNEEDISRWMKLVADINASGRSEGSRRSYEVLPKVMSILDQVCSVLDNDQATSANTLQRSYPSLAKFLSVLSENTFFLCNEDLYKKLMRCFLIFSERNPNYRTVQQWAMHQMKLMISGPPQSRPIQAAVSDITGSTTITFQQELRDNLLKTLQAEMRSLQSRHWDKVIGGSLPICLLPGSTVRELSQLCLPVLESSETASLVESLLCCQVASDVLEKKISGENTIFVQKPGLSQLLEAVSSTQQNGYEEDDQGALHLSYEALVNLWLLHIPSFESEVMNLVEACLRDPVSDAAVLRDKVNSRQLPKACASHALLQRVAEEIFRQILTRATEDEAVLRMVSCFAQCLKEA